MFIQSDATLLDELVREYGLDALDKKIMEFYLSMPAAHRQVMKTELLKLAGCLAPEQSNEDEIEYELQSYRLELEAEQKGTMSSPSAEQSGA